MKTDIRISLVLLLISIATQAQVFKTDSVSKAEISKLKFIIGNWNGSGWALDSNGGLHKFTQTENVELKLDGTILLIEGTGKTNGVITHNALAIVTYNKENSNFKFNSWLASGLSGEFKAELIGKQFFWYPNENVRYILYINDQGQWYETGEMNHEGSWKKFFEMTLSKQKTQE